jgi:predicted SprT family Zn-dependent metalloprotease
MTKGYQYITYTCDCEKKYIPVKEKIEELKTYFCFECKKQLSMEFV